MMSEQAFDGVTPGRRWLNAQRRLLLTGWSEPLHTIGAWDEDVFEWWSGKRKLTVHLENGVAEYLMVWGPGAESLITSGFVDETGASFPELWAWLHEGQ